jgi:hypothetical protein
MHGEAEEVVEVIEVACLMGTMVTGTPEVQAVVMVVAEVCK